MKEKMLGNAAATGQKPGNGMHSLPNIHIGVFRDRLGDGKIVA